MWWMGKARPSQCWALVETGQAEPHGHWFVPLVRSGQWCSRVLVKRFGMLKQKWPQKRRCLSAGRLFPFWVALGHIWKHCWLPACWLSLLLSHVSLLGSAFFCLCPTVMIRELCARSCAPTPASRELLGMVKGVWPSEMEWIAKVTSN